MALSRPVVLPMPSALARDSCVVAFARPPVRPAGFSLRDRIELERWSLAAASLGISRFRLEPAEPTDPPGIGGFLLVYQHGEDWARWGVAPVEEGMELWSMIDGQTCGRFPTLCEALARIVPV